VYDDLRRRITGKEFLAGAALPAETKLGAEYGVSLITVRRAIDELALDGLVQRRHGLGNFVRDTARDLKVSMTSFTSDVAAGRLRLVRTLLVDDMTPAATEIADKLGVQEGSLLRRFVRLDVEGGEPFSLDEALIPPALAAAITPEIAASPLFMHEMQRVLGLRFVSTQYDISARLPDAEEQRLLGISAEVPLLITGELVFDVDGAPRLWVETRYRGDRSRLAGDISLVQKKTPHGVVGE
jgi:GntR family transcriptional regulator